MSELNGFSRYEKLMADFAPNYIKPLLAKRKKDPSYNLSKKDLSYIIFNGFSEISSSLETLKLTKNLISLSPPKSKKIKHSDYLIYHIHVYFQEMYILKERLITHANKIQRAYGKIFNKEIVTAIMKPAFHLVNSSLKNIVDTRSSHVHGERYSDEDLKWLASFNMLSDYHEEYKLPAISMYISTRKKWKHLIKNNNEKLQEVIDTYFDTIYNLITKDDKVLLMSKDKKKDLINLLEKFSAK